MVFENKISKSITTAQFRNKSQELGWILNSKQNKSWLRNQLEQN